MRLLLEALQILPDDPLGRPILMLRRRDEVGATGHVGREAEVAALRAALEGRVEEREAHIRLRPHRPKQGGHRLGKDHIGIAA